MTDQEKWLTLCQLMERRYPVLSSVWSLAQLRFGNEWTSECVNALETVYGEITPEPSQQIENLIDGYAEFCNDSMRNQVFYEKTGRYRASNYEEAAAQFYHNEEHMTRRYLPGMFVSHFVWPQHYHMQRGFRKLLLPRVTDARLFFEVGVGCGLYSKLTLDAIPEAQGVGFDISQFALDYTDWMIARFGLSSRYSTVKQDISLGYITTCDFLICQEVLEHLENPAAFCAHLCAMVKPGGHAYITAALNAAHSDHIYLFHEPSELETMLRDAGFQPLSCQEEAAPGLKPRRITPSLCGFFCEKTQ